MIIAIADFAKFFGYRLGSRQSIASGMAPGGFLSLDFKDVLPFKMIRWDDLAGPAAPGWSTIFAVPKGHMYRIASLRLAQTAGNSTFINFSITDEAGHEVSQFADWAAVSDKSVVFTPQPIEQREDYLMRAYFNAVTVQSTLSVFAIAQDYSFVENQ